MKITNRPLAILFSLVLIASLLLTSCQMPQPPAPGPNAPTTVAEATVQPNSSTATAPAAAPLDLPPVIVATSPQRGQEQPLAAPVVITFDQPMDAASTAAAFAVSPEAAGDVSVEGNVLTWTPADPLTRSGAYRVTLSQDAQSATGEALAQPLDLRFNTVGFLEVTSTQPARGNAEFAVDAPITVIFNHPVVPLTGVDDQADLPDPLVIDPAVEGTGQWLNTSIYSFKPAVTLASGTDYTVTVPKGLTDPNGNLLAASYVFTFTTSLPVVLSSVEAEDATIWPTKPISVTFSQPMDQASTEAAFSLRQTDTKTAVSGDFAWREDSRTLVFTPAAPLAYDAAYTVSVDDSARAAVGEGTLQAYTLEFNTVPKLAVRSTTPADKATNVGVEEATHILLAGVVDQTTLGAQAFSILPKPTEVFSYFTSFDNDWTLSWPRLPDTAYTLTLSSQIADVFGNTLGEQQIFFQTGPRKPFAHLNVPNDVGTYNAYNTTTMSVSYRNVSELNFTLSTLNEAEGARLLGPDRWDALNTFQPRPAALLRQWTVPVTPERNVNTLLKQPLGPDGDALPPGLYWIEMRAPEVTYDETNSGVGQNVPRYLLIVSPLNLITKRTADEILVWATDLQSGQPVADLPIRIGTDSKTSGVTDKDGLFRASLSLKDPWQPVIVFAGDATAATAATVTGNAPIHYGVTSTDWQSGLSSWDFNLSSEIPPPPYQGYFYTDRPIYRPGQTVYWKGILRVDEDAIQRLPEPGTKVDVIISNDRGDQIYNAEHETNAFGTINGELPLAEEASLGFYNIEVRLVGWPADAYFQPYFGVGFQVAEYRKPEFTVNLTTNAPEVLGGDVISNTLRGEYFFGGAVSSAPVTWRVYSEEAAFNYTGDTTRWYSFNDYTGWDPTALGRPGDVIASGSGKTAVDGSFAFVLPADISDKTTSQRFTLDATLTDLNNQQSATSATVTVHKGLVYPGVAPRSYVSPVNAPAAVDILTVDWNSQPVARQKVTITVSEAEWLSVQKKGDNGDFYWTSEVKETPVLTDTVTTDTAGEAVFTWTPEAGGQYKITAIVVDKLGNAVRSSNFMWISAGGEADYVAWQVENNDRIEMVADKPLYEVGDTAKVLVPHPYDGPVQALVTVERGNILETRVMTLASNSETLEVPILADYLPNVYLSVVLVKGGSAPQPATTGPLSDGLGSFKLGLVKLNVDTAPKAIHLTLTPSETQLRPGQVVTFTVQAADAAGEPLETELSLALIDKAILSLANDTKSPLLTSFYRERGLSVMTASNLVLNLDRLNLQLTEGGKGGGGGGDGMAGIEVRNEFADTALWNPQVVTDANGQATISVKLPDNLTTWQLEGLGVTVNTDLGQATVDIRTTLPLLVRPVLPRFFTAGDQAEIGAVVNNNTDTDRTVDVALFSEGLTTSAPLTQTVSVPANQQVRVTWPVAVPAPTAGGVASTVVRFAMQEIAPAEEGAALLGDAVETTVPVLRYSSPETVATAGSVDPNDTATEVVVLPANVDATQGELRVRLEASLAASTLASLRWLEAFPYECNEQIVSKFLPNVATYAALQKLGVDQPELATQLKEQIAVSTQRLLQRQNPDGGWGWWANNESEPFVSSYVVFGLVRARAAGFAVDSALLERAVAYLQEQLKPVAGLSSEQLNQQAFLLYVLAEADAGDVGRTGALYEVRERLAHYGKALLTLAFVTLDDPTSPERSRVLLDDLTGAAVVSATGAHWEEEGVDWLTMNSDVRSTGLALSTLTRLDPENGLAPNVVRWLVAQRVDGHWATTQENVWSILALTDRMQTTGELQGDYSYSVAVNRTELASGAVTAENVTDAVEVSVPVADLLADHANGVTISRSLTGNQTGEGQLYYTTYLDYFLPAAALTARDRGVTVAQQYHLVDPITGERSAKPITSAKLGDTIEVKVTIVAPTNLYYLAVESPLPAGAEAIDPSLANVSVAAEDPDMQPVDDKPWYWWTPTAYALHDDKVTLFTNQLAAGTYEYTYQMRASLPGQFQVLPAVAYEMYFPEVWGRSAGAEFVIGQ